MPTLPLSSILVLDRERTDLGDIEGLMESLATYGQLMPLLIRKEDNRLIDGGRRFTAMTRLEWADAEYLYREDVTDDELKLLEVEVNERRKAMTWIEKCRAIRKIHNMRKLSAARIGQNWTYYMTGMLMETNVAQVNYATLVAEALDDPTSPLHKADNMKEALRMLGQLREDALHAQLVKDQLRTTVGAIAAQPSLPQTLQDFPDLGSLDDLGADPTDLTVRLVLTKEQTEAAAAEASLPPRPNIPLSKMFHLGDAIEWMFSLKSESVDHVITDPPYGIDMENLAQQNTGMGDIDRIAATHDVDQNVILLQQFIKHAFRIIKPGGWCIFWYDLDHHEKLGNWAREAGFGVQRWPYHWIKVHPCLNQQANKNWTKAIEHAMCLRKGNATLVTTRPTNYIAADGRVDRAKYSNPFAKPFAVWTDLMNAVAIRGQTICDPFAGENSGPLAAIQNGFVPLANEIETTHYNAGIEHVKRLYLNMTDGKVDFS